MTIVHRLMYSTFGGGGGGNSGPSTSKPSHTLDTLHSNTHWAVGQAPSKPYGSKIPTAMILACSSKTAQVQLLASREVNGPLCRHRKGFLDHLRPRPVIVSVSDDSFSHFVFAVCKRRRVGLRWRFHCRTVVPGSVILTLSFGCYSTFLFTIGRRFELSRNKEHWSPLIS
jgi:hypothetical protein